MEVFCQVCNCATPQSMLRECEVCGLFEGPIRCNERLPEKDIPFLGFMNGEWDIYELRVLSEEDVYLLPVTEQGWSARMPDSSFTHWMPLPPKPE